MRHKQYFKEVCGKRYRLARFREIGIGSQFFDWFNLGFYEREVMLTKTGPRSAIYHSNNEKVVLREKQDVYLPTPEPIQTRIFGALENRNP